MSEISIFIGSSSEARKRGIVPKLVQSLGEYGFKNVKPWYGLHNQGQFTLEMLLEAVFTFDTALLVFASDDVREFRGRSGKVTRDNVVLECGLFLGQLGRERVWILQESEVELPIDLAGLTVGRFRKEPEDVQNADLEICVQQISKQWKDIQPATKGPTDFSDSGIGIVDTLRTQSNKNKEIMNAVREVMSNTKKSFRSPFEFDSISACVSTYAEALDLVNKRFWTTTFLSSGFWKTRNMRVLSANRKMMQRLVRTDSPDIRRLFLLSRKPNEEIEFLVEELSHFRRQEKLNEIERLKLELETLKDNIQNLIDEGCEVKIAHDDRKVYKNLPKEFQFDPEDSEIAIYDDFRVDVFVGGRIGVISGVKVYSKEFIDFEDTCLYFAQRYFERLWETAEPIARFLDRLESSYDYARARIDYTSNYLAKYEFHLAPEDEELKTVEINRVEEILKSLSLWGEINRYLDVGTCTARYPLRLREAVSSSGVIIGIDDDLDCINFSKALVKERVPEDRRIRIEKRDFCSQNVPEFPEYEPFDLITCMLGTISHFGWGKNKDFDDLLQISIEKFKKLLADNGILILSSWSRNARENRKLLRIYTENDVTSLIQWTPSLDELEQRLKKAGLVVIDRKYPHGSLDLIICKHQN